jgi:choline-sulfatase
MKRPNILFLMADQLAATILTLRDAMAANAPSLWHLAEKSVVFDNFYCNSPLCSPSRFTMMSGSLPKRIGAFDNAADFPADIPTFAHYLRAIGYRTALAGKMHFCGPDQLHGFEERLTTDIYPADYGWTPDWTRPQVRPSWYHNMLSVTQAGPCLRSNQLDFDDEVTYAAKRHVFDMARSSDERPFCLVVSWTHPHDPYAALPQFMARYRPEDIPMPSVGQGEVALDPHSARLRHVSDMDNCEIADEDVRRARHAYLANVSYVDRQVASLLEAIADMGLEGETIVLFTADHGDMLGERGLWYKMNWFEAACRVPLVMHVPNSFKPKRVNLAGSHIDLLPTLAELAEDGKAFEPARPIDGCSLLPQLAGIGGQDLVLGEYCGEGAIAPLVMIREKQWKFVHSPADPDQLYDLTQDPLERTNLAQQADHRATLEHYRDEVAKRWDLDRLHGEVLESQSRRRLVASALAKGRHTPWDHQPIRDASTSYMRNNLVLDDLEHRTRWPRTAS